MCLSVCLSFTRVVSCCLCLSHTHVITLGVLHYWEYISRYFLYLIINCYIWTCPWSLDVFLPIWQRPTWKSQKTAVWSRSRARMDQMSCSYCISSSLRWLNMDFMTGKRPLIIGWLVAANIIWWAECREQRFHVAQAECAFIQTNKLRSYYHTHSHKLESWKL